KGCSAVPSLSPVVQKGARHHRPSPSTPTAFSQPLSQPSPHSRNRTDTLRYRRNTLPVSADQQGRRNRPRIDLMEKPFRYGRPDSPGNQMERSCPWEMPFAELVPVPTSGSLYLAQSRLTPPAEYLLPSYASTGSPARLPCA